MEAYQQLEKEFGEWIESPHVVACASGSAALHLALEALQLPHGSEVLTSDFNMIAVPRSIVMAGLVPVFVDCGRDLNIDAELVCGEFKGDEGCKPQAMIPVHIYGRRCDMGTLVSASGCHCCFIIEDLAEAHGVQPHPLSDLSCYSFYKNKVVAGEEGGAVCGPPTSQVADRLRSLRSLGFTKSHNFMHEPRGWNHRMSNAHADLILESLRRVDENVRERRRMELEYDAACPHLWKQPYRNVPWVYDLRVPGLGWGRQEEVVGRLNELGVAARCGFKPMSVQPEFKGARCVRREGKFEALRASEEVFYLPLLPRPPLPARDIFERIIRWVDG